MFKNNNKKDLVVFIICCFISILLFLSRDFNSIKNIKSHFLNFFSIIFYPKVFFDDLASLENQNDSLMFELKNNLQENKVLKQRLRDAQEYYKYIQNSDKDILYDLIPAKVLNHSFSASSKVLNLNVGYDDGVPSNYKAVINYDGNLIGRTYFISNKTTQVHKINDKNFHVFVKTKNNIKGQFSYINGIYGIVESVPKKFENQLNVGDTIFTSFNSNIYAGNIPIGGITAISNNPNKHELDIKVEIFADLNSLRNVFIVK